MITDDMILLQIFNSSVNIINIMSLTKILLKSTTTKVETVVDFGHENIFDWTYIE